MIILANRHNAGFGNPNRKNSNAANKSRALCLQHAFRISQMLEDYRSFNGDGSTLVGSALYNVTMAATTFVAEIYDGGKDSFHDEIEGLNICLRTMREMEHTEIVAHNVVSIVQATCRVCRVCEETFDLESLSPATSGSPPPRFEANSMVYDATTFSSNQTTLAMWPAFDFEGVDMAHLPFAFEQQIFNGDISVGMGPMGEYL